MVASVNELINLARAQAPQSGAASALSSFLSRVQAGPQPFLEQAGKLLALKNNIAERERNTKLEQEFQERLERAKKRGANVKETFTRGRGGTKRAVSFPGATGESAVRPQFQKSLQEIISTKGQNLRPQLSSLITSARGEEERKLVKDVSDLILGGRQRKREFETVIPDPLAFRVIKREIGLGEDQIKQLRERGLLPQTFTKGALSAIKGSGINLGSLLQDTNADETEQRPSAFQDQSNQQTQQDNKIAPNGTAESVFDKFKF